MKHDIQYFQNKTECFELSLVYHVRLLNVIYSHLLRVFLYYSNEMVKRNIWVTLSKLCTSIECNLPTSSIFCRTLHSPQRFSQAWDYLVKPTCKPQVYTDTVFYKHHNPLNKKKLKTDVVLQYVIRRYDNPLKPYFRKVVSEACLSPTEVLVSFWRLDPERKKKNR